MITVEQFTQMVKNHDLTYMYSDDGAVSRRGFESLQAIKTAAKDLDPRVVKTIWNAEVDKCLAEGYRKDFYWRG